MDIGFYMVETNHSKKDQSIIEMINKMISNHIYDNIILFNNRYNRIDNQNKFPIIHINQAKYFRGVLVVFDIKSAMLTKTFYAPKKQILYVDEIEWSKQPGVPALFWKDIYSNPNILTIAKNKEIYDLLKICWNKPEKIIENFNDQEFYDVISKI